jgi:uncharacterized phage infection (PIP) family protein YhgE
VDTDFKVLNEISGFFIKLQYYADHIENVKEYATSIDPTSTDLLNSLKNNFTDDIDTLLQMIDAKLAEKLVKEKKNVILGVGIVSFIRLWAISPRI